MFALTLPLIIAHGKFTMLDDMKDDEMESFVSFLVKCDKNCNHIEEPPWWLPNLPFVHPIKRPNKVTRKWRHKLKSLIKKCYKYYDCEILIDLSAKLAHEQQKNNIKLIVRCSHLTSVYNNAKSMIIVTIRNENLTYDLDNLNENFIKTRKLNRMCYSCNRMADLVFEDSHKRVKLEPEDVTPLPTAKESFTQNEFLNMFELSSKENSSSVFVVNPPRSNHCRINFTKAPHIPFSSQLGRRLAKKIKYFVQDTTHMKRLERIGRYLNTSPIPTLHPEIDFTPPIIYPKHSSRWYHTYKFPGKTYKSHLRNYSDRTNFLASKCLPCSVEVVPFDFENQVSENEITECIDLTDEESDNVIFIERTTEISPSQLRLGYTKNSERIIIDDNEVCDSTVTKDSNEKNVPKKNFKLDSKIRRRSNRLGTLIVSDEFDMNNLSANVKEATTNVIENGDQPRTEIIPVIANEVHNDKNDKSSSEIILKRKSLQVNVVEVQNLSEKSDKPSNEIIIKRESWKENINTDEMNLSTSPIASYLCRSNDISSNGNGIQVKRETKKRPRRKCAKKSFRPVRTLRSRKKKKN